LEARPRHHSCETQDLSKDWNPPHPRRTPTKAGKVLGNEVKKILIAFSTLVVLVSCGSSSSNESADYTAFCAKATELEEAAGETHFDDPAAISDTKVMADTWTVAVARAEELRDASPDTIKDDVTLMVSTLIDMNKIFKANKYNLIEMAKNEKIRNELDAISTRKGVAQASERFNSFMKKNCNQQ
jgi:hypothetical protein